MASLISAVGLKQPRSQQQALACTLPHVPSLELPLWGICHISSGAQWNHKAVSQRVWLGNKRQQGRVIGSGLFLPLVSV